MNIPMLLPKLLLALNTGGAAAAEAICSPTVMKTACLPCGGVGGTGDCTVIKRIQLDIEADGNVNVTAAKCCNEASRFPTCSVWTLNGRNGECIIKKQGIDSPTWNETGAPCVSGRGPGPLPDPEAAPPPPCPARPPPPPLKSRSRNLLYIVVDDLRNELGFTNGSSPAGVPNSERQLHAADHPCIPLYLSVAFRVAHFRPQRARDAEHRRACKAWNGGANALKTAGC